MYIIINNTTKHSDMISGDWPESLIESMLYNGEKFIVISLYSNTIKVPTKGETDWEWEDYNLPSDLLEDKHWFEQWEKDNLEQLEEWERQTHIGQFWGTSGPEKEQ